MAKRKKKYWTPERKWPTIALIIFIGLLIAVTGYWNLTLVQAFFYIVIILVAIWCTLWVLGYIYIMMPKSKKKKGKKK